MKNLFKATTYVAMGMALILTLQNIPQRQQGFDAYAQSGLQDYVTPAKFADQANQTRSSKLENQANIPYALPIEMKMYNIVGTGSTNSTINDSYTSRNLEVLPVFQDINGDGLADLIYSGPQRRYGASSQANNLQYVLINNGNGFDLVYFCKASGVYDGPGGALRITSAIGDCADPNFAY